MEKNFSYEKKKNFYFDASAMITRIKAFDLMEIIYGCVICGFTTKLLMEAISLDINTSCIEEGVESCLQRIEFL